MGVFAGPEINENGLVLALDGANFKSFKGEATTNLITNPTEEMPRGEFGQYRDLAAIFDANGLTSYSLSMDIKTNIPGNVLVYMQNGSESKYNFVYSSVNCTTTYQRFYFNNITPSISSSWQQNTPTDNRAILATYTGYGSGINPTVKNIQLEQKSYSTNFVVGTRGTTVATGGGWADLSGRENNGELVNGVREDGANGGSLVFDGTNDFILTSSVATYGTNTTWEAWIYATANASGYNMFMGRYLPYFGFYTGNSFIFSNNIGGSQRTIYSPTNLSYNTWYHAVFTTSHDGANTTMKIYTNGIETATGTWPGAQENYSINFMLGDGNNSANNSWYPFQGRISNVKVYNKTLTASEIRQNFNATRGRFGI